MADNDKTKEIPVTDEAVSDILKALPKDVYDSLMDLVKKTDCSDEYVRQIFTGDCPVCGSEKTSDCDDLSIEDVTVGVCLDCYTFWCTECDTIFEKGQTACNHWKVCEDCELYGNELGCGVETLDCETIIRWKEKKMDH